MAQHCRSLHRVVSEIRLAIGIREQVFSLLEETRGRSEATAWVVFNDALALPILRLLNEAAVRLVHDLSLVSFDNTMPAQLLGLTSYNFNYPAVANAVLEHILAPQKKGAGDDVVEVPGTIVERQTSGRVNAQSRS